MSGIPSPVIAVITEHLPYLDSHAGLDNLFLHADAPGDPPEGSKPVKVQAWLRRTNKESPEPLRVLGRLIEPYVELEESDVADSFFSIDENPKIKFKNAVIAVLSRGGLQYFAGGIVTSGHNGPSRTLEDLIRARDLPSIQDEFDRALKAIDVNPRDGVSSACNILESTFKIYIHDERLEMPKKQDLQGIWKLVREHLGFEAGTLEDDDLKKIISGLLGTVDGIGALRTHESSAHGRGRKTYKLKPRHARLAVNAAHTIVVFVLETWDERASRATN